MKTLLLGFRVKATRPIGVAVKTDDFELRQAAIECAQLAAANGWRNVRAFIVTREAASDGDWIDDEQLDPIWPGPAA